MFLCIDVNGSPFYPTMSCFTKLCYWVVHFIFDLVQHEIDLSFKKKIGQLQSLSSSKN